MESVSESDHHHHGHSHNHDHHHHDEEDEDDELERRRVRISRQLAMLEMRDLDEDDEDENIEEQQQEVEEEEEEDEQPLIEEVDEEDGDDDEGYRRNVMQGDEIEDVSESLSSSAAANLERAPREQPAVGEAIRRRFVLGGDEDYVAPESPRIKAARRKREEEEYYDDEYGQGNPDMIRLRYTDVEEWMQNPCTIDVDDETEEHAAGMILPKLELEDMDIYFRELSRVCVRMGTETTRLLTQILVDHRPLTPPERKLCQTWVKFWSSYVVENHYLILGKLHTIPTGPGGTNERWSGTMAMMLEIWRLKLILNHHRLPEIKNWKINDSPFLVEWLLETPGVPLEFEPVKPVEPEIKDSRMPSVATVEKWKRAMEKYQEDIAKYKATRRIAETPIMALRQSQIRHLAQYLTKKMRIIPYCEDIRTLIELIELKTSIFFCQTLPGTQLDDKRMRTDVQKELDALAAEMAKEMSKKAREDKSEYAEAIEDALKAGVDISRANNGGTGGGKFTINRDFLIYCVCYLYPTMRCLYYVDLFPLMRLEHMSRVEAYLPAGAVQRVENWMRNLAKQQGDKYYDRINDAADEALRHPGDLEWQSYKYPQESTNIEVVIRKVRGEEEYEECHTMTGVSYGVMLDQVNKEPLATHYVLTLFDRYLNTYKATNWMDGYVIQDAYICEDDTFDKWTRSREPMLIQIFSNYWLLMDGKVLPINNVYVSICMWLVALRKTRELNEMPADCLADHVYIGDIIDKYIDGKDHVDYKMEGNTAGAEYTEKLKRGLDVSVTRIRI